MNATVRTLQLALPKAGSPSMGGALARPDSGFQQKIDAQNAETTDSIRQAIGQGWKQFNQVDPAGERADLNASRQLANARRMQEQRRLYQFSASPVQPGVTAPVSTQSPTDLWQAELDQQRAAEEAAAKAREQQIEANNISHGEQQQLSKTLLQSTKKFHLTVNGKQAIGVAFAPQRGADALAGPGETAGQAANRALSKQQNLLAQSNKQHMREGYAIVAFARTLPGAPIDAATGKAIVVPMQFAGTSSEMGTLLAKGQITRQDLKASGIPAEWVGPMQMRNGQAPKADPRLNPNYGQKQGGSTVPNGVEASKKPATSPGQAPVGPGGASNQFPAAVPQPSNKPATGHAGNDVLPQQMAMTDEEWAAKQAEWDRLEQEGRERAEQAQRDLDERLSRETASRDTANAPSNDDEQQRILDRVLERERQRSQQNQDDSSYSQSSESNLRDEAQQYRTGGPKQVERTGQGFQKSGRGVEQEVKISEAFGKDKALRDLVPKVVSKRGKDSATFEDVGGESLRKYLSTNNLSDAELRKIEQEVFELNQKLASKGYQFTDGHSGNIHVVIENGKRVYKLPDLESIEQVGTGKATRTAIDRHNLTMNEVRTFGERGRRNAPSQTAGNNTQQQENRKAGSSKQSASGQGGQSRTTSAADEKQIAKLKKTIRDEGTGLFGSNKGNSAAKELKERFGIDANAKDEPSQPNTSNSTSDSSSSESSGGGWRWFLGLDQPDASNQSDSSSSQSPEPSSDTDKDDSKQKWWEDNHAYRQRTGQKD